MTSPIEISVTRSHCGCCHRCQFSLLLATARSSPIINLYRNRQAKTLRMPETEQRASERERENRSKTGEERTKTMSECARCRVTLLNDNFLCALIVSFRSTIFVNLFHLNSYYILVQVKVIGCCCGVLLQPLLLARVVLETLLFLCSLIVRRIVSVVIYFCETI